MRHLIVIALLAGVVIYLRKRFGQDNDLQASLREQRELQKIGQTATATNVESQIPVSMIGDTPFAGVHYDPFNVNSPAAAPKELEIAPIMGLPKNWREIISLN